MSKGIVDRRTFVGSLMAAVSTSAIAATAAKADHHGDACKAITAEMQQAMSPDDAINALKAGNARFIAGETVNCDYMSQVKATADGQYPIAAIVGCIDSRVPPELVFDQQIGDIFSARVAGNFVNTDIIGSLEFATAAAGSKAIVILAHSACGAVKGAVDEVKLGNLTAMLENIEPAIQATPLTGEKSSSNTAYVEAVATKNAELTVAALLERSPVIKGLVDEGKVKVVAAKHDVATGKVTFLS
ncbi:MAG: carbonic anhydrase family protein [Rhodospirillaceae bacterium]